MANYINEKFEPVWVSVREVPTVTIDFGKGKKIKRTLHGNVASYVLTADGTIVDILPGLYDPVNYNAQLDQLWWVHKYANSIPNKTAFLTSYHSRQENSLKISGKPMTVKPYADRSKMAVEISTKTILMSLATTLKTAKIPAKTAGLLQHPDFADPNQLARWSKLAEDTDMNERVRRAQIHKMLAVRPQAKPADVTKQLYRDVLHADLDDPYLGLGETLFRDYPFREDVPATL